MPTPTAVRAMAEFRIWLRYDDGTEGAADLSELAGRRVFRAWSDRVFFPVVRLGSHGAIGWDSAIGLCPDAMYMRLTGKSPEQVFPAIRLARTHA